MSDASMEPAADSVGISGSPTIYDVARVAGVSPSTVSRALSRPGRISATTERKVRDTAAQLGFRVNPSARALPTGRTMTLALLLADITNPVVFGIVRGAERAAAAAGYTLVIAESQESAAAEQATALRVGPSVDGIVFATSRLDSPSLQQLARSKPSVLINRAVEGVPSVVPDVETGVLALVEHLKDLGHVNVGYLAGPQRSWVDGQRWDALLRAGRASGLRVFEFPGGEPTLEGGSAAYERVAASPATAVVAFNDLMAIGLLRTAQQHGVVVPDDLSIAGFDDIFGSELTTPTITTVAAPLEDAGEQAVALLLDHLEPGGAGEAPPPFPTSLIRRQSTGRRLATG
jgi:LacI family transcriptional regulator